VAATGIFAPQLPQKIAALFKGEPHLPQKFAMTYLLVAVDPITNFGAEDPGAAYLFVSRITVAYSPAEPGAGLNLLTAFCAISHGFTFLHSYSVSGLCG
jgi:hypothetical protein